MAPRNKVLAANKKIAKAASKDTAKKMATARKLASGPVGAKMIEMMDVPSFARGLTPQMLIDLRAKNLMPATAMNKTQRISVLKDTHTLLNEAASMDAPKEVKEKTFLEGMRKRFGDFADNPIVRKIASRALMILAAFPTALDFIPMSLLEEGMDMMNKKDDNVYAGGGIVGINEMTRPVNYG